MTDYVALFSGMMLALFQVLIVRKSMGVLLGSGKKDIISFLLWTLYFALVFITINNESFRGPLLLLGNIAVIFFIAVVIKRSSFKMKLFSSILIFSMWAIVEAIVGLIISAMGIRNIVSENFIGFISQMLMLIIVITIEKFKTDKFSKDISLKTFLMLSWIPIISVYFVFVSIDVSNKYQEYEGFATCVSVVLLLTNYIIFDIYIGFNKNIQLRAQNKLYIQQLQLCSRQTAEQEATYKELRRLRHDMKNHLTSLLGMVDSGNNKQAKEYIEQLLDDGKLIISKEVCRTGNIIIDSLINYKYAAALELGVDFDANVFVPAELPFKNEHLVIILGNLLENAIESCMKVDKNKRYIHLEMSYEKNMLQICVKNSCTGEKHVNRDGVLLTTKKDKANHGMGVPSIKMAASEYDGDVLIRDLKDEFIVVVVLYEK